MRIRSVVTIVLFLSGCAAGEDIGEPSALEFGGDDLSTAEIVIEVADAEGELLPAYEVWVSSDAGDSFTAGCMTSTCDAWVAEVRADEEVTAYASVCGDLYESTLAMPGTAAVHVTIVAECAVVPET